ncbi:DUF2927 domain-containing protein [bacterium]|nr:DUF2927 domain-containing protein [bacterium]
MQHRLALGLGRVAMAALLALAGCAALPPSKPATASLPHPSPARPETAASAAIREHYAKVQAGLLATGLLRTEMAPPDEPFNDRNLTENFLRIALYEEYAGGQITRHGRAAAIRLQRWDQPIRVALIIGAAVPPGQVATDRAWVTSYFARLARVTGHPIVMDDDAPNFWVHIATVDERAAMAPTLNAEMPGLTAGQIDSVVNMDDQTYCQVLTETRDATSTYTRAVAVIPSEHPDLMRLACIHEELAQAMGLPNDSNAAHPSIFNDDQEFALLTKQDEMMLRILYNPALHPGMTEAEARPIVQTLASRLLGGEG